DNLSRRVAVGNTIGALERIVYDLLDRATKSTDFNGVTTTNTFDNLDRLLTRGHPDGGIEKFGYSARGLIAYTNQIGASNFYFLNEASWKLFETNANNELIQYQYNSSGIVTNLIDGKSQSTKWGLDQFNRVTNKLDQAGVEILRYTWDGEYRLLSRWSKAKGT